MVANTLDPRHLSACTLLSCLPAIERGWPLSHHGRGKNGSRTRPAQSYVTALACGSRSNRSVISSMRSAITNLIGTAEEKGRLHLRPRRTVESEVRDSRCVRPKSTSCSEPEVADGSRGCAYSSEELQDWICKPSPSANQRRAGRKFRRY